MVRRFVSVIIICQLAIAGFIGYITLNNEYVVGDILFVGGIGPGNYSSIQDAINASSDGDTVYVYAGTYYENITVNKSITLMGEGRDVTTIDGMSIRNVIFISANWANVTGFTLTNSGPAWSNPDAGIKLYKVSNVTVRNNKCTGNKIGIVLDQSSFNTIDGNICNSNVKQGIQLRVTSNENTISNSQFKSNEAGIVIYTGCSGNTIIYNDASSNTPYHGINLDTGCHGNLIAYNEVYSNTDDGIILWNNNDNNIIRNNTIGLNGQSEIYISSGSDNNQIYHNNLVGGSVQVYNGGSGNSWDDGYPSGGNYWSDFDEPGEGAYDDYQGPNQNVAGSDGIVDMGSGAGGGKNPYGISGGGQDNYPFIEPMISPPSAPLNPQADVGAAHVNLTWEIPLMDGGSSITLYNIYRNGTAGVYDTVPASQLWYNDTDVITGIAYTYNISAVNSAGEGPHSADVRTSTLTIPSEPLNLLTMAGNAFVNITWDMPINDGGSSITMYCIYRNGTTGVYDSVPASQLWYNDTNVINGLTYTYNVTAVNSVGEGPNSSGASATPMTIPSEPLGLQAAAGDEFVNITWNVSMDDGGSPVTMYNIYRNGTVGIYDSVPASQMWYNDTSVINGITYTYNITAVNIVGEGPNSTPVSATPMTIPSEPPDLQTLAGDTFVNLSWSVPIEDGGSPITFYNIYRNGTAGIYDTVPASRLWYNDTDVINGLTYTYNVSAVNSVGEGPNSSGAGATPMTVPSEPPDLHTNAGDAFVNLTWTEPFDDGGSPIIFYNIYRNGTAGVYDSVPASQLWYNDTDVINGLTYTYNVSAVNSVGMGPESSESSATPMTIPSQPRALQTLAGDTFVNLTWTVPLDDGGSPILLYYIYRNGTAGIHDSVPASRMWYNDTDVVNGITYTYNITAVNIVGEGPNSTAVSAIPMTIPSEPRALQTTAGDTYVNLSWSVPIDDGGSPIILYNVYRNGTTGIFDSVPASQLWHYDTDVTNGITYTYNVSAVNGVGQGPYSTGASAFPLTIPSAPGGLLASTGDNHVYLTWNEPSDDGGSPVTTYNIYREDEAGVYDSVPASRLWYNDTDVVNGQTYTYTVSASNAAGEGSLSDDVSATPMTTPSTPENLQISAGDSYVHITWEAPTSDGGSAITGYIVHRTGTTDVYASVPESQLWYNDTDVTNGNTYSYNVIAVNRIGEGPKSTDVSATPLTTPSAPPGFLADAGDGHVYLSWGVPIDDGGSPVTLYHIYRNDTTGIYDTVAATQLSYDDTNVMCGIIYKYCISAANMVGSGPESVEAEAKPATLPRTPENLRCSAGDGFVHLAWEAPSWDGGSAVTGYNIYRNDWSGTFMGFPGRQLWYNDTHVVCGVTYTYTITAVNQVGEGPNSFDVNGTPMTIPQAPMDMRAVAGDGCVDLSWEPPVSDGGSPVTGYRLSRRTASGIDTVIMDTGNVHYYRDTDIESGIDYFYTVTAVNSVGEGPRSSEAGATLEEEEDEGIPWWLWVLVLIIAALTVIILILVLKSRRKEEPQVTSEQTSSALDQNQQDQTPQDPDEVPPPEVDQELPDEPSQKQVPPPPSSAVE